ncbi:TPA: hypothetical protein MO340_004281 [Salmonella enterica subsp. salamae serovar 35:g,m,s,t:-]|nr:hypothetical protein [Salmonella enterica subsp. salamae serovar 35:g,m,s,t:-]HCA3549751.1 hypothetical protein [Salmonella enterica subsp. salamae serovar 35:g,m,s,t:-]
MSRTQLKYIARIYTILIGFSMPVMILLAIIPLVALGFGGMHFWYGFPVYGLAWLLYIKAARKVENFLKNESQKFVL